MNWTHKRNETKAQAKKNETSSGTRWDFIAAAATIAA
jgi:hypothetical protein